MLNIVITYVNLLHNVINHISITNKYIYKCTIYKYINIYNTNYNVIF